MATWEDIVITGLLKKQNGSILVLLRHDALPYFRIRLSSSVPSSSPCLLQGYQNKSSTSILAGTHSAHTQSALKLLSVFIHNPPVTIVYPPSIVFPAMATCPAIRQFLPNTTQCPICTRLSILFLFPLLFTAHTYLSEPPPYPHSLHYNPAQKLSIFILTITILFSLKIKSIWTIHGAECITTL